MKLLRFIYNLWLRRQLRKVIERDLAGHLQPGKGIHELPMHEVRRLLQASGSRTKLS